MDLDSVLGLYGKEKKSPMGLQFEISFEEGNIYFVMFVILVVQEES